MFSLFKKKSVPVNHLAKPTVKPVAVKARDHSQIAMRAEKEYERISAKTEKTGAIHFKPSLDTLPDQLTKPSLQIRKKNRRGFNFLKIITVISVFGLFASCLLIVLIRHHYSIVAADTAVKEATRPILKKFSELEKSVQAYHDAINDIQPRFGEDFSAFFIAQTSALLKKHGEIDSVALTDVTTDSGSAERKTAGFSEEILRVTTEDNTKVLFPVINLMTAGGAQNQSFIDKESLNDTYLKKALNAMLDTAKIKVGDISVSKNQAHFFILAPLMKEKNVIGESLMVKVSFNRLFADVLNNQVNQISVSDGSRTAKIYADNSLRIVNSDVNFVGAGIAQIFNGYYKIFSNSDPVSFPYLLTFFALAISSTGTIFLIRASEKIRQRTDAMGEKLRKAERELKIKKVNAINTESKLKHLIETVNVIPWTADLDRNVFTYVGPQIEELTGYPAEYWLTPGHWMEHIYQDDRSSFYTKLNDMKGDNFTSPEYRICRSDGALLWIRNSFTLVKHENDNGGTEIFAHGFMFEITAQKNLEHELRQAYEETFSASKTKSDFLATMSHELRTPLNSIIGFAEIMSGQMFGPLGSDQYVEYAGNIQASGKHLLELINDILDLSKIEAGQFEIMPEDCEINELFRACRILMQERALKAGLKFSITNLPENVIAVIDERRIKQVLINLLSNAIKFTEKGGEISMYAEYDELTGLKISVSDTGIGIKPENIEKVFDKFGQVEQGPNRGGEGTGLGLTIAKSLIEMHGGRIGIRSVYGQGTTVSATLPVSIIKDSQTLKRFYRISKTG